MLKDHGVLKKFHSGFDSEEMERILAAIIASLQGQPDAARHDAGVADEM